MNKNPSVTAVIPLYNHQNWILDAIDSVASQDYKPLRIVVVDDGSTDGGFRVVVNSLRSPYQVGYSGATKAAVGKTKNEIDVLALRYEKASGPAFARNRGIEAAWDQSDYFALLDSDDLYEPGKISKSVEKFLESPENIGCVYSDFDTLRPDGLRLRQYKEPFSRERLVRECIVNCDSLVSKAALETVGLFAEELRVVEDYDLWLRMSEKFILVHLAESLVTIRVGMHSSTSTVQKETWQRCYQRVMERTRERMLGFAKAK